MDKGEQGTDTELPFKPEPDIDRNGDHREQHCIAARSEQFTGHFAGHGIHATETRVWIASHHRLLQRRCSPVRSTFAAFWQRRSEEHTSELQSLMRTSYAVFCLKKKNYSNNNPPPKPHPAPPTT